MATNVSYYDSGMGVAGKGGSNFYCIMGVDADGAATATVLGADSGAIYRLPGVVSVRVSDTQSTNSIALDDSTKFGVGYNPDEVWVEFDVTAMPLNFERLIKSKGFFQLGLQIPFKGGYKTRKYHLTLPSITSPLTLSGGTPHQQTIRFDCLPLESATIDSTGGGGYYWTTTTASALPTFASMTSTVA